MSFPLFAPRRPASPPGSAMSGAPANGAPVGSEGALPANTRTSAKVLGPGAASHGRARETLALLLWTASIFSLLALATFAGTPPDAVGADGAPLPPVTGPNWVGPVGEAWARGIVHLVGVIGWSVPFELAALGVPFIRGRQSELSPPRLAGDLLIAIVLAALVQVGWPEVTAFGNYRAAGLLGELFGEVARSLFSTVGSFLVGFALLGLILIARASFSFIGLVRIVVLVVARGITLVTSGVSTLLSAWRSARDIERDGAVARPAPRIERTPLHAAPVVVTGAAPDVSRRSAAPPAASPLGATGFEGDDAFDEPPAKRGRRRRGDAPATTGTGAPALVSASLAASLTPAPALAGPSLMIAGSGTAAPSATRRRSEAGARPRIRVETDEAHPVSRGRGRADDTAPPRGGVRGAASGPAASVVSTALEPTTTEPARGRGRRGNAPAAAESSVATPSEDDGLLSALAPPVAPIDTAAPPSPDLAADAEASATARRGRSRAPARRPTIVDTSEELAREEAEPSDDVAGPATAALAPGSAAAALLDDVGHERTSPAPPVDVAPEPAAAAPTSDVVEAQSGAGASAAAASPSATAAGTAPAPDDASAKDAASRPPIAAPPKKPAPRKVVVRRTPFHLPPMDLLEKSEDSTVAVDEEALGRTAELLTKTLSDYGVSGKVEEIVPGPTVTTYEVSPVAGTKVSKVAGLADDLALALGKRVRIVAPIPGKTRIGFELENPQRMLVKLRDLCDDRRFFNLNVPLPVVLGRDIRGRPVYADLAGMPHVIVAGATGAGKSVGLNVMLTSLLYRRTPEELKLLMIDPKVVELAPYDRIPHMLLPVVTDMKQAATALKWAVDEMERRYQLFAEAGTKNIDTFNGYVDKVKNGEIKNPLPKTVTAKDHNGFEEQVPVGEGEEGEQQYPERLPHIVIVVDEFADLMMQQGKDVEAAIARLAQKARAAGMHVILATQRPSVNVITGMIKANFPTRIAFRVAQKVDSRTILDEQGAEHLLGKGDMLIKLNGTNDTRRVQCPWVSEGEVQAVTDYLRAQGTPVYDLNILKPREEEGGGASDEEEEADELYDAAVRIVADTRRCSTSWLQRKLEIGYNRAARIVEMMERNGIVGPANGAKDREVLIGSI